MFLLAKASFHAGSQTLALLATAPNDKEYITTLITTLNKCLFADRSIAHVCLAHEALHSISVSSTAEKLRGGGRQKGLISVLSMLPFILAFVRAQKNFQETPLRGHAVLPVLSKY